LSHGTTPAFWRIKTGNAIRKRRLRGHICARARLNDWGRLAGDSPRQACHPNRCAHNRPKSRIRHKPINHAFTVPEKPFISAP